VVAGDEVEEELVVGGQRVVLGDPGSHQAGAQQLVSTTLRPSGSDAGSRPPRGGTGRLRQGAPVARAVGVELALEAGIDLAQVMEEDRQIHRDLEVYAATNGRNDAPSGFANGREEIDQTQRSGQEAEIVEHVCRDVRGELTG